MCNEKIKALDTVYIKELIYYIDNFHFALMMDDEVEKVCNRLEISRSKFEKLLNIALENKFLNVFFEKYPYQICTTNKGLAWAAPVVGEAPYES